MSRRTPWWRKPYDEKENDDEVDEENKGKRKKSKKTNEQPYGEIKDDWLPHRRGFPRSPFDDEFDRFFSRSPFLGRDDPFKSFERDMEEMHERMDKIFQQAMDGKIEKPGEGGPFVYGFSMRTGPDGVPHVQEFGNMSPEIMRRFRDANNISLPGPGEVKTETSKYALPSREPLTDIMEHDDHFIITLELPGIERKDIDLEIEDGALVIDVDAGDRKYYKKLPLPSKVDPKSISASFKNGVLDVKINRLKPKQKKGKKIKIK